jgi:solute carrier family 25 S-adenosylmethionine transporter 26
MRTWDTLCAGGLSGVTVDVILFPLDTIKTRLQARSSSVVASRSFYKGLLSAMSASFPCAALFWVLYDGTKAALLPHTQGVRGGWVTPCVHVGAAAVADVFVTLLRNPFEVVKQQMQIGSHRSTLAAVRTIAAVDGLRGFYAGYVPTLAREIPFDAVQFALYEAMKSRVVTRRGERTAAGAVPVGCVPAQ